MESFSLTGAARALREGSTTSVRLAEQVLARSAMVEAQVHAYLTLDSDALIRAANEADEALAAGRTADHCTAYRSPSRTT